MDGSIEYLQTPISYKRISKAMKVGEQKDVILEEDDGEYELGILS